MFTVELDTDHTRVVALDEEAAHEDVEMYLEEDNTVFMRQWAEDLNEYQLLIFSYQQLLDLVKSLESGEGMHFTLRKDKVG